MAGSDDTSIEWHALLPIIKALLPAGVPTDLNLSHADSPVLEPYVADLAVAYVLDKGDDYEFINEAQAERMPIRGAALRDLAVTNLRRTLPSIEPHGSGPAYMLVAGGNLESSLLLLDDLWESQASMVEGDLVVAVPARDVLIFTGSTSESGVASVLGSISRVWAANSSHLLSRGLLVRTVAGWRPFPGTPPGGFTSTNSNHGG